MPISEILRLRKLHKSKFVGGVEFRADNGPVVHQEESAVALKEEPEAEHRMDAPRKFASQTGTVGNVNKHIFRTS